ncbi:hypothetical protein NQZ68_018241 [Dissostichus eleginoides]|nr:hypothetical protein NQZ68_018241 [Dissostichus eleginoides]
MVTKESAMTISPGHDTEYSLTLSLSASEILSSRQSRLLWQGGVSGGGGVCSEVTLLLLIFVQRTVGQQQQQQQQQHGQK